MWLSKEKSAKQSLHKFETMFEFLFLCNQYLTCALLWSFEGHKKKKRVVFKICLTNKETHFLQELIQSLVLFWTIYSVLKLTWGYFYFCFSSEWMALPSDTSAFVHICIRIHSQIKNLFQKFHSKRMENRSSLYVKNKSNGNFFNRTNIMKINFFLLKKIFKWG